MDEMEYVRKITKLFYLFRKDNAIGFGQEHPKIRHRDFMMLDAILSIKQGDLVKMSDISAYLQVTPAAVSQFIKNYEHKGWVERVVLNDDRRSVYIKVSQEARQVIDSCQREVTDTLYAFIKSLGEEDAEAFVRILEKAYEFSAERKKTKEKGASE